MANMEMGIVVTEEAKQFLEKLTKQIDRLEELSKEHLTLGEVEDELKTDGGKNDIEVEELADEVVEGEDDFAKPTPTAKKGKKSFDDDEEAEEAPAPKKGKAKKLTNDDCNDAAKELAASIGGKKGIDTVRSLMKKHFNTDSTSELEPEQFADFIACMKKGK